MKRIDSPHVAIDGSLGPAGHCYGQLHSSCPVDGLTFQCPAVAPFGARCGHIFTISWDELDELNKPILEQQATECIHLPTCPACGSFSVMTQNDIEYGVDLPQHHTMKIIRQHIAKRPAFKDLQCHEASRTDGKHQGVDFSHLRVKDRPAHHRKVDLAAELAATAPPRIIGDNDA
jgi:hypothetical protein